MEIYCRVVLDWQLQYHTHTHIYIYLFINVKICRTVWQVTSRLACRYFIICCSVVLNVVYSCVDHVVTMPPVGRGRCWITGNEVSLRKSSVVLGGGGCDCVECCCGMPGERWCARSTRLRGRTFGRLIFCLESFLDVASFSWCRRSLILTWQFLYRRLAVQPALPLVNWQIGVASRMNTRVELPWWEAALCLELWVETGVTEREREGLERERVLSCCLAEN